MEAMTSNCANRRASCCVQKLDVLHAMAEARKPVFALVIAQVLVGVQHLVVGAVTYCVHRHSQPHLRRLPTQFEQLLRILVQDPPVFGLPLIWLEHSGRAGAKGPVHEDLHCTNAQ